MTARTETMAFMRCAATAGEIRIALAGDWGTGTDEAAQVAALIEAWRPHYSIHLGDIYYVGDPGGGRREFPWRS